MATFLAVLSLVTGTAYTLFVGLSVRALYSLGRLDRVTPKAPEHFPKLSVVLPACNEAETIEPAIRSLLRVDYPDLEIIVVDDRSTDGTGEIVDRLSGDPRLKVLHIDELPDGWLGKVHALARGLEKASGEWVLFADADVRFQGSILRKTVALAIERGVDHLPAAPRLVTATFPQAVAQHAFGILLFSSLSQKAIHDPESDLAVGIGAFNLFKKSVYDRSPGLEWLRVEVADDVGLGLLLKRAGGRAEPWIANHELEIAWYDSLGGMARGLEKNMFAVVGRYRASLAIARSLGLVTLALGPFASLAMSLAARPASTLELLAATVGVVALATTFFSGLLVHARVRTGLFAGLVLPVGLVLCAYMIARSTFVCMRAGGIVWRGTRYSFEALRAGQRILF